MTYACGRAGIKTPPGQDVQQKTALASPRLRCRYTSITGIFSSNLDPGNGVVGAAEQIQIAIIFLLNVGKGFDRELTTLRESVGQQSGNHFFGIR